jgi:hypothetical protein
MKTSIFAGIIAAAGVALSTLVGARDANAFCSVCPAALERPTPRSGFWADPDRAGSSMTLENQNGTWGGVYYGYDTHGAATWYTFSGVPERAQQGVAYWTLDAPAAIRQRQLHRLRRAGADASGVERQAGAGCRAAQSHPLSRRWRGNAHDAAAGVGNGDAALVSDGAGGAFTDDRHAIAG